jgi:hypothetical protein
MKINRLIVACLAGLLSVTIPASSAFGAPKRPDSRQAEAIKVADSQCTEVDKSLVEIQKTRETLEKTEDASTVSAKTITELNDQIKFANNRLSNAERAIKNLSAGDPDVKAQADKIAAQRATLAKASEVAANFSKKLGTAVEVGNKPDFKTDVEKVKAMGKAYAPFNLSSNPKQAADLAVRVEDDTKTLASLAQTYKPIIQQHTPEGKEFSYALNSATNNIKQFRQRCQTYVDKGEATIGETLAKALKMAEQAAADKKPAFFTGGVRQQMDIAKKNLQVYVAIVGEKDEKTLRVQAAFDESSKKIETLRSSLKEEILASTKTPPDLYKGADKAKLKGLVEAEWKKLYPKDQLLSVRFITPEWKRNSGADWSAAFKRWEDFDHSDMTVRVVVKNDDKLSTLYWVYLTKDHKSNDLVSVNANTKGGVYVVEEMLTSNFEP